MNHFEFNARWFETINHNVKLINNSKWKYSRYKHCNCCIIDQQLSKASNLIFFFTESNSFLAFILLCYKNYLMCWRVYKDGGRKRRYLSGLLFSLSSGKVFRSNLPGFLFQPGRFSYQVTTAWRRWFWSLSFTANYANTSTWFDEKLTNLAQHRLRELSPCFSNYRLAAAIWMIFSFRNNLPAFG